MTNIGRSARTWFFSTIRHSKGGVLAVTALTLLGFESRAMAQESAFSLMGPSIVMAGGARFQRPPNDDTLDRGTGGFKIAPISMQFMGVGHVSAMAFGIYYVGSNRVAGVLSPLVIGHSLGIGVAVDFYTMRDDDITQRGGNFGVSLNLDVMALHRFVSRLM
jgi:hypothetical protein